MNELLNMENETINLYNKAMVELQDVFKNVDEIEEYNTIKVLNAFWNAHINESHFNSTTGYGYGDIGRDAIEEVYKSIFHTESALVRTQFISGSHTLSKTLFGLLRPGDLLLSITGTPYDTLHKVIGIEDSPSSLKSFGVKYSEIDLVDNDFDYDSIEIFLKNNKVKVIEIQRSRGYSKRESISIQKCEKVIKLIKSIDEDICIMVDNCYCELVSELEPSDVGADVVVGSLIKNLGAGIAPNGGYVVGKKKYLDLIADSLTLPGEGAEVGPTLGANKPFLQGLFFAPSVVASALKTAILASYMLEQLGYQVSPSYKDERADIVQTIIFGNPDDVVSYCEGIQSGSPIDSYVKPIPVDMPGYKDQVIMASGAFTQGSSIDLSCDAPMREPYIAYQQGGLTFTSARIGVLKAINEIIKRRNK